MSVGVANAQGFSTYEGRWGVQTEFGRVPGPHSPTQSTDTSTVSPGNSVSCNGAGLHTDNSYIRRFFLGVDHGIVNSFYVKSLDWAIEQAAGVGGVQPVNINLYRIPVGSPLTFANMTLISTDMLSVADASLSPINSVIASAYVPDPTTTDLVVEVFTPEGQTAGNSFFIGSNPNGETQPSYLAAAVCGITEPTTTGSIGFPGMQLVMVVNGIEDVAPFFADGFESGDTTAWSLAIP
jgi:hypothetical protein